MNNLETLCHRHCRDRRTARWVQREHSKREIKIRKVFVPERNIDRYYMKWNYEKQPELFCNGLRGRYW